MEPTESDFIGLRDGVPMIRETDVTVQQVVNLWRGGVNMADIPSQLPGLTVAQVFAALRYYRDHPPPPEQP
ncbi:MAG: DUF433 domain-containing protein [Candidatus Xenobia bacterium]